MVRPLVRNRVSPDMGCRWFHRLAPQERVLARIGVGGGKRGVKGDKIQHEQSCTGLLLNLPYRMRSDSCRALECDPSGFQFDEDTFRGHHGAFLWAKGFPTKEDEHMIGLLSRR